MNFFTVCSSIVKMCNTAGVYVCVQLTGAYHNSKFDSLVVRGLTVGANSWLSCRRHSISKD